MQPQERPQSSWLSDLVFIGGVYRRIVVKKHTASFGPALWRCQIQGGPLVVVAVHRANTFSSHSPHLYHTPRISITPPTSPSHSPHLHHTPRLSITLPASPSHSPHLLHISITLPTSPSHSPHLHHTPHISIALSTSPSQSTHLHHILYSTHLHHTLYSMHLHHTLYSMHLHHTLYSTHRHISITLSTPHISITLSTPHISITLSTPCISTTLSTPHTDTSPSHSTPRIFITLSIPSHTHISITLSTPQDTHLNHTLHSTNKHAALSVNVGLHMSWTLCSVTGCGRCTDRADTSAPSSRRTSATLLCPYCAARCRAVLEFSSSSFNTDLSLRTISRTMLKQRQESAGQCCLPVTMLTAETTRIKSNHNR